ncbi:MAG: hypothetical protein KC457_14440 [Myxococcales bacterium]|nr:hypothetical protein [Myxococcales bacterium]
MTREAGPIDELRAELAARPLDRAGECPSWRVYADWLLAQGDPRGEWLALALAGEYARTEELAHRSLAAHDRQAGLPADGGVLALYRKTRGWSSWLGPFALVVAHPGLQRMQLRSQLGAHGALLLDARAWTIEWISIYSIGRPMLVPVAKAGMMATFARAIRDLAQKARPEAELFFVESGEVMERVYPPIMAINPGPVYDPEEMRRAAERQMAEGLARMLTGAVAILCCPDAADLRRHAETWKQQLAFVGICVILGPPEVLAAWPHPHK